MSTAWCVVQATASKPRAPSRWRRRSKATGRCRRSTSAVCGPLARVHSAGTAGRSRGNSRVRGRGGRRRLVVVVGAACASAGSAHGVVRGAGNDIEDEGAVALAAMLKGNTTLQTLDLGSMSTARTRAFCGSWRPLAGHLASARAERARAAGCCGRRGVRECGQQARRGAWCRQPHPSRGRRCAGGGAPRQHDAADAHPRVYVDRSHACIMREWAAAPGGTGECAGGEGASGWWLWSARRARVRAVRTAWCVVQTTTSETRAPLRWRRRSKATRRCRRSTSTVCGPLASVHSAGMGRRSRGTSRVRERRGASGWWL